MPTENIPTQKKCRDIFISRKLEKSRLILRGGVKFTLSDATFSPFGGNMQILYSAGMELQASAIALHRVLKD